MEPILVNSPDLEMLLQSCEDYYCLSKEIGQAYEEVEQEQEAFDRRSALLHALRQNQTANINETIAMNKSIADALFLFEDEPEFRTNISTMPAIDKTSVTKPDERR